MELFFLKTLVVGKLKKNSGMENDALMHPEGRVKIETNNSAAQGLVISSGSNGIPYVWQSCGSMWHL